MNTALVRLYNTHIRCGYRNIMIISEQQDTRVFLGESGAIAADPKSILNLLEQNGIPNIQVRTLSENIGLCNCKNVKTHSSGVCRFPEHRYFYIFSV